MPANSVLDRASRTGQVPRRPRASRQDARDVALAVALAVLGFVPTLSTIGVELGDLPERPADALAVTLVLAQCLPLALRRRSPGTCLAVVGAAFAVDQVLSYPPTFAGVGLYVALYTAGAHQVRLRRSVAALATGGYLVLAVTLSGLGSPNRLPVFLAFYLVLVVIWLTGAGVRRRRAEEVERRRLAAAVAASEERARIARDLHDVVTHHVTAMVVQADAAQFLLPAAPDRAAVGLVAISGTGRRALTELRHLLGVLEATGESASAERAPVLGRVGDLVERARRSGQPVEWTEEGGRRDLPDAVELAAYRVVQEGLTNALKHAPERPTTVRVRHGAEHLMAEVTTGGPAELGATSVATSGGPAQSVLATAELAAPAGRGLAGLRERVRLLDGDLEAGPTPDGGFRVRARIPTFPSRSRP
ncbi:sensor histidine kinase [Cellulosimicrobium funkei]|uniref:sensor histidine kinase n=1 Tax=Cellulosimicrobium funkei TaxID=264251 RepID=UPI0030F8F668